MSSADIDGDDHDGLQKGNEETKGQVQLASRAAVTMFVVPCWHYEDPFVKLLDEDVQGHSEKRDLEDSAEGVRLVPSVVSLCTFIAQKRISKFEG